MYSRLYPNDDDDDVGKIIIAVSYGLSFLSSSFYRRVSHKHTLINGEVRVDLLK
jgi:hypothetical protein